MGIGTDIENASEAARTTGLKEAESALRLSEMRYRFLVENSTELVGEVSPAGIFLYTNPQLSKVLGYSADELIGSNIFALAHPEELESLQAQFTMNEASVSHRCLHKDGSWRWLDTSGRGFMTPWGEQRHVLIARDVTERRKHDDEIRESRRVLLTLMSNLPGMAYRTKFDTFWTVEFVSEGSRALTGYAPEDLIENRTISLEAVIHPEDRTTVREQVKSAVEKKKPYELNYRITRRDGEIRWVWERGVGIFGESGELRYLEGFITDVTERQRAEERRTSLEAQLRQSQKLEAIGTLAGGIAHDFNNILSIMMGYAELARMNIQNPSAALENISHILKASSRAKDLVNQILSFSRPQVQERRPILLEPLLREAVKLLRSTLPTTIEISLEVEEGMPQVLADSTQVHQVIMNLCTNAAHAMRNTLGSLRLRLSRTEVEPDGGGDLLNLRPGSYAKLAVVDTGHGMDEQVCKRVFEPFFTTKAPGEGTGLGLSVVHGIIRDHNGGINVRSRLGKGTTFEVFLPLNENAALVKKPKQAQVIRGKGERLMFVDDEVSICAAADQLLKWLGYRVVTATDPVRALEAFRQDPTGFDAVVTDLTMPVMTGPELAAEMLKIRPSMPIFLSTGYAGAWNRQRAQSLGFADLLQKPISHDMLSLALSGALRA